MFAGPPDGANVAWERTTSNFSLLEDSEGPEGYTIHSVVGHSMVRCEDSLLIWGGYCIDSSDETHYRLTHQLFILPAALTTHSSSVKWIVYNIRNGEAPPPTSGACAVLLEDTIIIFGGFTRPGDFHADGNTGLCWNNQLLVYDRCSDVRWSSAKTSGSIPSPRAASASVYMEDKRSVLLFGGRHDEIRLCDLYILDMNTLIWSNVEIIGSLPVGRSWCTLSVIDHENTLLFGGYSTDGNALSDCWSFHFNAAETIDNSKSNNDNNNQLIGQWVTFGYFKKPAPRLWHTAAVIDGLLFVCGGSNGPLSTAANCSNIFRMQITPPSLLKLCLCRLSHRLHDVSALPHFIRRKFKWLLFLRSYVLVDQAERNAFQALSLKQIINISSFK
ncbi:unnamed protein product [Anisakis simplex]|uniref:Kelch repeat protein n=1 Tax=Anisakis simplex TaxID=6269 RepID=A0A0M3K483_ANISI|nr:unnamed protein product [Anisakis simplex]